MMNGVSYLAVVVFYALFILGYHLMWQMDGIGFRFSYVLLVGLVIVLASRIQRLSRLLFLTSLSLLFAIFQYLLYEIYSLNPLLPLITPTLDIALFSGLMTVLITRAATSQWYVITLSMILADVYGQYGHRDMIPIYLGNKLFFDVWSLTVFTTMMTALVIELLQMAKSRFVLLMRRPLWRKNDR